jgi:hypothetical protein
MKMPDLQHYGLTLTLALALALALALHCFRNSLDYASLSC